MSKLPIDNGTQHRKQISSAAVADCNCGELRRTFRPAAWRKIALERRNLLQVSRSAWLSNYRVPPDSLVLQTFFCVSVQPMAVFINELKRFNGEVTAELPGKTRTNAAYRQLKC